MKLLIITQKIDMNDGGLGFFHAWVKEFAQYYEKVEVICLYEGYHILPENVQVHSLGKEHGQSRIKYLYRLYKYLFTLDYDRIFVHMNQIYVPLVELFGKPIYLWYMHKQVSVSLHIATHLVKKVFTASPESFRIASHKKVVISHGIDTDLFSPATSLGEKIIAVGRISRIKGQVDIAKAYLESKVSNELLIVGGTITPDDKEYERELKSFTGVTLTGPIAQKDLPDMYRQARVFVHNSRTGSLDKVVLEALACGLTVVSVDPALKDYAYITDGSVKDMAEKIKQALEKPLPSAREYVVHNHNLHHLIKRLVKEMQ